MGGHVESHPRWIRPLVLSEPSACREHPPPGSLLSDPQDPTQGQNKST